MLQGATLQTETVGINCLYTFQHAISEEREMEIPYNDIFLGSRDSSDGIATRYGLDVPGIKSRWGRDFPQPSRPALGSTQPHIQWVVFPPR